MLPALCRADNNGPVIRPAVPADADQVAGLAAALAQSFPFSPAACAASFPVLVAAPDVCLLVADGGAELGGYLLGFRHLTFFANGPVGWVEEILVAESSRGTGTGRALMTAFERWAAEGGCALAALATRRAAPFYRALGYEETAAYFGKRLTRLAGPE
jgi:GNAT superfamily N-acetyltransferase